MEKLEWLVLQIEPVSDRMVKMRLKPFFRGKVFADILELIKKRAIQQIDGWWFYRIGDMDKLADLDDIIYHQLLNDEQREIADLVREGVHNG